MAAHGGSLDVRAEDSTSIYVIYLPFALRVAIGTGAAAVSLPVTCRHFYADFPSNIRKCQFMVTLHHEIKRLRKQKQMPANYPFKLYLHALQTENKKTQVC